MKLFALQSSFSFGEKVAAHLNLSLSSTDEIRFEDGEYKIRSLENVNGEDVYVIHSLYTDSTASVNDKLNRLLFFIGSLKDASAAKVTAIIPYLAYSRKDRRTKQNDPLTTKYVARLFEAVGTDRLLAMDVHNIQAYQNAFNGPAENLEAISVFSEYVSSSFHDKNLIVFSPDIGGLKRVEKLHRELKNVLRITPDISFMQKYRNGTEIRGDEMIMNDMNGKVVIINDDLISTGKTIARAAAACKKAGAEKVIACVTHGLFAENPDRHLNTSDIDEIIVTNTIESFNLTASSVVSKVKILDVSSLFAEVIKRMNSGENFSELVYT